MNHRSSSFRRHPLPSRPHAHGHEGFTLLELLVVLVIIGLLAGIVGPRLFGNVSKSEVTAAKAQIDILAKALDQYRLDMGRYPSTQEGLAALVRSAGNGSRWRGPYLRKDVPLDPWGVAYQYKFPAASGGNGQGRGSSSNGNGNGNGNGSQPDDFALYSFGADKAPGGTGDAADIGR